MARLRKGQTRKPTKRERELLQPDLEAFHATRMQYAEVLQRLNRMVAALEPGPDVRFDPDKLEFSRPPTSKKGKAPRKRKKGKAPGKRRAK